MSFLTSLRGLAAILVVLYHASYNVDWPEGHLLKLVFSQGFLAVDFFFVLSGFIIAYTYSDRFSEFTWSNYRVFLWKRFARIYPLHLFVMLLFVSITVVIFITGRPPDSRWYPVDGFFFKVLLIDAWWTGYATTWNVPSWSISAEWFVYLTFPCLLRPFVGASLQRVVTLMILLLLVLTAIFAFSGMHSIGNGFSYFGIIRCVFEFSLGIGVFAVTSNPKFRSIISGQKLLLLALLLVVICPLAGLADFWFIPLVFVLVLIGLLSFRGWVHRVLEHKVLVYLGEISYSVYLVHYFVKDVMVKAFLETVQSADLVWVFANVVVTLGLSALTYHWVEMPSRRFLVSRIK